MIVRPDPQGWCITFHPAHGLLAAEIFAQFPFSPGEDFSWLPTLLAVAEHDDHQLNFSEGHYLTTAGAPQDFAIMSLTDAQRSLQAEELWNASRRKHRWIARLVGKHIQFLYNGQKVDARLKALLHNIETFERNSNISTDPVAEMLDKVYGYMRFCDRLSLILCGDEVPTLGRSLEINDGLGQASFLHQQPENGNIIVEPWPFGKTHFTVGVERYLLPQLSYKSSAELGKMLASTPAHWREWTLAPA